MNAKQMDFLGTVVWEHVNEGSKSERDAVMLKSSDGATYILRKQHGPAFGDETLNDLVGHVLSGSGITMGDTLIMQKWQKE